MNFNSDFMVFLLGFVSLSTCAFLCSPPLREGEKKSPWLALAWFFALEGFFA